MSPTCFSISCLSSLPVFSLSSLLRWAFLIHSPLPRPWCGSRKIQDGQWRWIMCYKHNCMSGWWQAAMYCREWVENPKATSPNQELLLAVRNDCQSVNMPGPCFFRESFIPTVFHSYFHVIDLNFLSGSQGMGRSEKAKRKIQILTRQKQFEIVFTYFNID